MSPLKKCLVCGEEKWRFLCRAPLLYVLSSVLAGAYLTVVGHVFWLIKQGFGTDPMGKLIAALFFGVGLTIIVMTRVELFTSNAMYMTVSTLGGRTKWSESARLWSLCYAGNFVGAAAVAFVLWGAGTLSGLSSDHALLVGAHHKAEIAALPCFLKGILANWCVCLAVWVNLHLKEEGARIAAIVLIVFIFLYAGFEHSIANMGTFALAALADPSLPLGGASHNLLWSTLGNLIGGGLCVGAAGWLLGRGEMDGPAG